MPKAILFDLDSTIITWEDPPVKAWAMICQRYAPEITGLEPDTLQKAIRSVADWYWSEPARHRSGRLNLDQTRRKIVRMALTRLNIDNLEFTEKIADVYSADREQTAVVLPEAIAVLKELHRRGIKLAMITNGEASVQRTKIQKFNLAPYFNHLQIEGEFGIGKPDKRVFLHTLEKLKIQPADAWMVGDDLEYDIAPCRPLGIYSLWVNGAHDPSKDSNNVKPDKVIGSISEIPGLL